MCMDGFMYMEDTGTIHDEGGWGKRDICCLSLLHNTLRQSSFEPRARSESGHSTVIYQSLVYAGGQHCIKLMPQQAKCSHDQCMCLEHAIVMGWTLPYKSSAIWVPYLAMDKSIKNGYCLHAPQLFERHVVLPDQTPSLPFHIIYRVTRGKVARPLLRVAAKRQAWEFGR